jgi:hypothetical protein
MIIADIYIMQNRHKTSIFFDKNVPLLKDDRLLFEELFKKSSLISFNMFIKIITKINIDIKGIISDVRISGKDIISPCSEPLIILNSLLLYKEYIIRSNVNVIKAKGMPLNIFLVIKATANPIKDPDTVDIKRAKGYGTPNHIS